MEIESVHKYIALNKQANGNIEVMFAGQPCLTVTEMNIWTINPVFAKLVYGANIFEDIPQCSEASSTSEEAIAAGLLKLYDLGAFRTEIDFPEDTYAATMNAVVSEATVFAIKTTDNIYEAFQKRDTLVNIAKSMVGIYERDRSEFVANLSLSGDNSGQKSASQTKKFKLKSPSGTVLSSHDTESAAMNHFKSLSSSKGIKIVKEENDVEDEIIFEGEADVEYAAWENSVRVAHPDKALKFKGRVEQGMHTTSAEVSGEDRSYGVWDHSLNTGNVFTPEEEAKEEAGVQAVLRKNKPFAPKKV